MSVTADVASVIVLLKQFGKMYFDTSSWYLGCTIKFSSINHTLNLELSEHIILTFAFYTGVWYLLVNNERGWIY